MRIWIENYGEKEISGENELGLTIYVNFDIVCRIVNVG